MTATLAGTAVLVEGVGKRFELRTGSQAKGELASVLSRRLRRSDEADFWALRDVTVTVPRGEIMGVIGRNGSGKTTLMKIIAGITAPTTGQVTVVGRVGAMLRMGTGFHPELTGRDNIAISGAILGMSREQVEAVEKDVLDFADIGRFVDVPVKHYSSGMSVRLAFGISSYMPGDVMIIDEALSVGDGEFQRKCEERIAAIVGQGRTVIFVSHSMSMIRELCRSAIVLDRGTVVAVGSTEEAIETYENEILGGKALEPRRRKKR